MIDDLNLIVQRDPNNALGVAADQWKQTTFQAEIISPENDGREIKNIVVAGMGGSALAATLAKKWLEQDICLPFEIVKSYDLPASVGHNTLFNASSYSGQSSCDYLCSW